MKPLPNSSRKEILLTISPSLVMFLLFYSLALHMRFTLGHWPTDIGERGFPPLLATHAYLTVYYFMALLLVGIVVVPVVVAARFSRRFLTMLAFSVFAFVVCYLIMSLAPAPFWDWWRD